MLYLSSLTALIGGCKSLVMVVMVNHYSFPIDVYSAVASPRYAPRLLGTIAPEAVAGFEVASVPDGQTYHFVLHNQQGKIIKDILVPSATANASLDHEGWRMELAPDQKPQAIK